MPVRNLGDIPGITGRAVWEVIASAATISPKTDRVRLTGNTNVVTINRPDRSFIGPLYIINTDAAVANFTAAGNIAVAVTSVRYKLNVLMFDPSVSKWYPANVA